MSRFYGKKPEPVTQLPPPQPVTLPATSEPVVVVPLPAPIGPAIVVIPLHVDTPVDDGDDNDVPVDDGEETENDS
jgi:hypothetical protein